MTDGNNSNRLSFLPPSFSLKFIVSAFSVGAVVGSGIGYGFQKAIAANQPTVINSARDYDALKLEMSPVEARSILGPGTETLQTGSTLVIEWGSPTGDKLLATFQEGRLVEKRQHSY